ncbi:response regulator [Vibrio sp. SCSIO 43132]|uniref:response regulator n=1 Tax=Vibrio sp. SCSIO 43132 TaxID=2779363 RepID=UPI001CA98241|nr:response regulator [Vibrio sp. SCSIO 43132]UAB72182.1 response regulator [Vibrio sp. SCSIO 43132]
MNVSVVDDSKLSRKSIIRILPEQWIPNLSEGANGKEAIELYEDGKADILFLDLTMPEMDGFEVLEYLHDKDAKTIVFVVSADIQPKAQERVNSLGAAKFLKKPIDKPRLNEALHEVGLI